MSGWQGSRQWGFDFETGQTLTDAGSRTTAKSWAIAVVLL